ncbi:MAG: patatin-like phospholipase family protein [Flavisolibacter sp.]
MSYKILSLDGGGSWAMIQAYVLNDLYPGASGHEVLRQFDMAIGNSGGSLVLAALCNNMSPQQIIHVFDDESCRKKVFSKLSFAEKMFPARNRLSLFRNIFHIGPKYKTTRKLEGLREILTKHDNLFRDGKISTPVVDTWMDELPAIIGKKDLQLIVAGFDYFRERVVFFRSNLDSNTDRFSRDKQFRITLGHAIHSSSNAPVNYFDEPASVKIERREKTEERISWFWDGGVAGFNNPVLAGLVEALTNGKGKDLSEYKILSLGTALRQRAIISDFSTSSDPVIKKVYDENKDNPYVVSATHFKFLHDIQKVAGSILSDPPDSASFIACAFLHPSLQTDSPNLVRINPCISPILVDGIYQPATVYKNDELSFKKLLDIDMDAIEDSEIELIKDLCKKFITDSDPCIPNQYIRGDRKSDRLGFGTYREAKKRWKEIQGESE